MEYLEALKNRRSCYDLDNRISITEERIEEVVKQCIKYSPSAYHLQSARAIILFGEQHHMLWKLIMATLKSIVPEDKFPRTEKKIKSFNAGYGTVLFFENQPAVEDLQKKFPTYADNFGDWSVQASGMAQFAVWAGLEAEGLGASLQHYNELIEEQVRDLFNVEKGWKLISQMVFGNPVTQPEPKTYLDENQRVTVLR